MEGRRAVLRTTAVERFIMWCQRGRMTVDDMTMKYDERLASCFSWTAWRHHSHIQQAHTHPSDRLFLTIRVYVSNTQITPPLFQQQRKAQA